MLWKRWKPNFKWLLLLLFLKDQSSKRLFSLVCLLFLPWLPINLFDVRIFHSYYPQLCPVKVFLKSLFGTKVMGQSKGTSIKCGFVNDITIIIIEHYGVFSFCICNLLWSTLALRAKINYRRLTEINSRYYALSLMRPLTHKVPTKSSIKEVDCTTLNLIAWFGCCHLWS